MALVPAITLTVGVFGNLYTESLRDSRLRRREEVARVDGRKRIFADRRDSIELYWTLRVARGR